VARIDTDGVRFVEDDAVAAVVDAIVASRSGNPGGAR
jgi:proteasome beta subunit